MSNENMYLKNRDYEGFAVNADPSKRTCVLRGGRWGALVDGSSININTTEEKLVLSF